MWTFTVCDLAGTPQGELRNAKSRRVQRPLSRIDTAAFTIRPDNPQADFLIEGDALLVVYDGVDPIPKFVGEVVTADEQAAGEQASIAVTCGGALARLDRRLVGKSTLGQSYGSASSQVDRGSIAAAIVVTVEADGPTGIRIGSLLPTSLAYVGPWYYKPAGEALLEVATPLDGFDFEFAPVIPVVDGFGAHLWDFNVQATFGQNRPDAVFEYGTGKKNVKSYTRLVDRSQLLNKGYNLPPGFPDNAADATVATASDPASIAARGLYEGVIPSDLVAAPLRQRLVEEHVLVRKRPRQQITMTPKVNLEYVFGTDYDLGDVVPFRAVYRGRTRINADFRLTMVAWNIDDNGNAQMEHGITPEDS